MRQKLRIEFSLMAFTRRDEPAGVYAACCPALDVYSQGETVEEAQEALTAAVFHVIEFRFVRRTLDDLLNAQGFVPFDPKLPIGSDVELETISVLPEAVEDDDGEEDERMPFKIDVPLHLLQAARGSGDHASCPS